VDTNTYLVQSAYSYLTTVDTNISEDFIQFLWLKAVPLKVNIFEWRLFPNRLVTKDNLRKRNVLDPTLMACATLCGKEEERDHLFFHCDHYGRLWLLISHWLGIVTDLHGNLHSHATQFCALGVFSKISRTSFTVIWISVLFVIWKDWNRRIFQNHFDHLEALLWNLLKHNSLSLEVQSSRLKALIRRCSMIHDYVWIFYETED